VGGAKTDERTEYEQPNDHPQPPSLTPGSVASHTAAAEASTHHPASAPVRDAEMGDARLNETDDATLHAHRPPSCADHAQSRLDPPERVDEELENCSRRASKDRDHRMSASRDR
jgi:hypothetical protein